MLICTPAKKIIIWIENNEKEMGKWKELASAQESEDKDLGPESFEQGKIYFSFEP